MPESISTNTLRKEFVEALLRIWDTTVGWPLQAIDALPEILAADEWLAAVVWMGGSWTGSITLAMPLQLAKNVAAHLLSKECSTVTNYEIEDALKEMTNMLGGNLKSTLLGQTGLAVPGLFRISKVSDLFGGGCSVFSLGFQCGNYSLLADLHSLVDCPLSTVVRAPRRPTLPIARAADLDLSTDSTTCRHKCASEARLLLALKSGSIGVWEWDLTSNQMFWDARMYELYGIAKNSVTDAYQAWEKGLYSGDIGHAHQALFDAANGVREFHTQFRIQWPDGTIRYIESHGIRDTSADGASSRLIGLSSDITERALALSAAATAKDQAIAANNTKSDFLARVSHELRTPMNGIIGMTSYVLDTQLNDEQRECLSIAMNCANSLLVVLNEVLDFSTLDTGRVTVDCKHIDIRMLAKQLLEDFNPGRPATEGVILCDIGSEVSQFIMGDEAKLKQVLSNLLANSLKYTKPHGAIILIVRKEPFENYPAHTITSSSMQRLSFAVADTGTGIPTEYQQEVFKDFSQAEASMSRRFGGVGLGLAICQRMVKAMGGAISFRSKVGIGTVFLFTIDFQLASDSETAETANTATLNVDSPQLNILLVEDSVCNQKLAVKLLEKRGHRVLVANDGFEALQALRGNLDTFSIVLMDCQMPRLDGFETTKLIRSMETSGETRLPIVAVTANAIGNDKDACLAAGMDGFISKPIQKEEFIQTVERQARKLPDQNCQIRNFKAH